VDLSLSCEGLCNTGLRATNGLEETDPGYKYCLCGIVCASALPFNSENCCTDYAATCASTGNQGSCTLVAPDGSTSELCGSYNDADLCGCDPPCVDFGDCCSEYTEVCSPPPPPPPSSCEGLCSEEEPDIGGICHCDLYCTFFGDCCFDYTDFCGTLTTCKGFCDDAVEGSLCECDVFCTAYNDCCADYTAQCDPNNTPAGEILGTAPCGAEVACGECSSEGEPCCCDQYCVYFANCCEGFNELCKQAPGTPPPPVVTQGNTQDEPLVLSGVPALHQGTFQGYTADGGQVATVLDQCWDGGSSDAPESADLVFIYSYDKEEELTLKVTLEINSNEKIYDEVPSFLGALTVVPIGDDGIVFDGPGVNTVCTEVDDRDLPYAFASLVASPGNVYAFFLTAFGNSTLGDYSLQLGTLHGDHMGDPIVVSPLTDGESVEFEESTLGFTDTYQPQPGDAAACNSATPATSADVWFEYKPQQSQSLRLDLCTVSEDYAAALYVVTSTDADPEKHVLCVLTEDLADDECGGYALTVVYDVVISAESPITYYFVVETKKAKFQPLQQKEGDFRLVITALTGNSVTDPIPISTIPISMSGTTEGFTDSNHPPSLGQCVGVPGTGPDVVYKYTATTTKDIIAWVCGESEQATLLYVYQVGADGQAPLLCSDTDQYGDCQHGSVVVLQAAVGEEYLFVVDAKQGTGQYTFFLEFAECDDLDFPCELESLPYDAVFSLAAHSDSVTVPPSCTAKDPDSVDDADFVLHYVAAISDPVLVKVCAPFKTGLTVMMQSAGAPQQQTFCYANCVAGDECVDYIVEAQVGNEVYLVIEGKANTAKDGSVLATSKPTDYEFLVSIQPFDGEEQNVCYGQLVGAAPGSSPPPPPPPSKTDDGTDGDNSDDGEDDGGSSAGAVLGAIVGILLLVGCIVGFVYYFRGRMAKGTPPATDSA